MAQAKLVKLFPHKSYLYATIILIAVIIWVASGIIFPSSNDEVQDSLEPISNVKVQVENIAPVLSSLDIIIRGEIIASNQYSARAQIETTVAEVLVKVGDTVNKGDTLIRLTDTSQQANYNKAKAEVSAANLEYQIATKLNKSKFASESEVKRALANLKLAKAEQELALTNLNFLTIKAVNAGKIQSLPMEMGDYVKKGDILAIISPSDSLSFLGYATEYEINNINRGDIINVSIPALNNRLNNRLDNPQHLATITEVSTAVTNQQKLYQFMAELTNLQLTDLSIGLSALATISANERLYYKIPTAHITLDSDGIPGIKHLSATNQVMFMPINLNNKSADHFFISASDYRFADDDASINGEINAETNAKIGAEIRMITQGQGFIKVGDSLTEDRIVEANP